MRLSFINRSHYFRQCSCIVEIDRTPAVDLYSNSEALSLRIRAPDSSIQISPLHAKTYNDCNMEWLRHVKGHYTNYYREITEPS